MPPVPLPRLNGALLSSHPALFPAPSLTLGKDRPERVLQFGEGGFLRGFFDWMIHRLNTRGLFDGSVVVVQPLPSGLVSVLNEQNGIFTQILRGVQNGKIIEEREVITSISRGVFPQTDFETYLACAHYPLLRFVVSNTTEAGIACSPCDQFADRPPRSFPAKLTQFLFERFRHFKGAKDKGLIMLPCELIEYNGANLQRCVQETARKWQLEPAFTAWLGDSNVFCNTLVDRIVTGYPQDEADALALQLGYEDRLLNTGEIFHSWVIEGPESLVKELPLADAGLNVTLTSDYSPYRDRKVRLLNGAHTAIALAAYLAGKDTVKECMDDPFISRFIARALREEIIPTLDLPLNDLTAFAASVSERFANPYVKHALLSISLNSTSKFIARILPSLKSYVNRRNTIPPRLSFSLAALIAFYRGTEMCDGALIGHRSGGNEYRIQDSPAVLEFFRQQWSRPKLPTAELVRVVLSNQALWQENLAALPELADAVTVHLERLLERGAEEAFRHLEK